MRYSIYSRFRGAILGVAIGARFCHRSRYLADPTSIAPLPDKLPINQSREQQDYSTNADEQIIRLVVAGMKSLIEQGRFDLEDWDHKVSKDLSFSSLNSIIATLPLALFHHENEIKLRKVVKLASAEQEEIRDIALAFSYLIALSLQAHPTELISQTIAFVGLQTHLSQKLTQVKTWLEQNAGIETVATCLDDSPSSLFALALYCYLSTVSDFRLSLRRVMQKCPQPHICAITGALSGAYNGRSSIPATLRQPLFPASNQNCGGGMTTEKEMLRLCDALVAVWSGVYDKANKYADLTQVAAITAPRVLRIW